MKRLTNGLIVSLLSFVLVLSSCNTGKSKSTDTVGTDEDITSLVNGQSLAMSSDSLDSVVISDIMEEIIKRQSNVSNDALEIVGKSQNLIQLIDENKTEEAIDTGHKLIGKLEVLLAKDPSLSFIPVDVSFQKNELVTDIKTVREIVKYAKKAMDNGYYQMAAGILEDLHSEIVISSSYIPTATYPDAIKVAVAMIEDGDTLGAKTILRETLETIVVERTALPLPVLKAEQLIKEAAKIDSADHKNSVKVVALLNNAEYQLMLAEEMGYGKKDLEYRELSNAISNLQKSVEAKSDSKTLFDSLKVKISSFKERLFSKSEKPETGSK